MNIKLIEGLELSEPTDFTSYESEVINVDHGEKITIEITQSAAPTTTAPVLKVAATISGSNWGYLKDSNGFDVELELDAATNIFTLDGAHVSQIKLVGISDGDNSAEIGDVYVGYR